IFLQWFGLDTFTIQENSHFLYPLFSLCTPIFNDQVQLVVKSPSFTLSPFTGKWIEQNLLYNFNKI
ncbi:hypothetical protein D9545_15295, partial [Geobacillus stearothermophilus]